MALETASQIVIKPGGGLPALGETFDALEIGRRVIVAPSRTIVVANIATVSTGWAERRQVRFLMLAAIFFALASAFLSRSYGIDHLTLPGGAVMLAAALASLFLYFKRPARTHTLAISANDGVLSHFRSSDGALLDEARALLTRKIEQGDEGLTASIDFAAGTIESPAKTDAARPQAAPQPRGQPQAGTATPVAQAARASGAAQGSNGHYAHADHAAHSSPAAMQIGAAHAQNGSHNGAAHLQAQADHYIDYRQMLSPIVDMHRFYASQPNTQHLEQRLHELELLMRAGAPKPHQKVRLRELTGDLSHILEAYPPVVQVFRDIAQLSEH